MPTSDFLDQCDERSRPVQHSETGSDRVGCDRSSAAQKAIGYKQARPAAGLNLPMVLLSLFEAKQSAVGERAAKSWTRFA